MTQDRTTIELAKAYDRGLSLREISELSGIHRDTIRYKLVKAGIKMRSTAGYRSGRDWHSVDWSKPSKLIAQEMKVGRRHVEKMRNKILCK